MQILIIVSLLGFAFSAPSGGYKAPPVSGGGYSPSCAPGEVQQADGSCVRPQVSRNVYLFHAPKLPSEQGPSPPIPPPKINYNLIIVRTPESSGDQEPIIVSPQEKTLIYVLTKKDKVGQQVIEVPGNPSQSPQVYYIHYNEGDNPTLPGGISLQEALGSSVSSNGQLISGGGGGGSSGSYGGGGISQTYKAP